MNTQTKQDRYELLCKQVESLIAGETNVVGMLANVSAAMKTMFPEEFFWVGFYLAYPQPLPKGKGEESLQFSSSPSFFATRPKGKGVRMADPINYGLLKENAKKMRNNPTEAETVLWHALKANALGLHFRRQHVIHDFIVDFLCYDRKLTIELDGGYHNTVEQKEYDEYRTEELTRLGYTELRFTNEEVIGNLNGVLAQIERVAGDLPSLQGGGGGRLLLGPFQGTVACYEIPFGKGVCGAAWKERRTLVVPDVEEFPGHIACSSLSRSEIVVPIFLLDEEEEDGRGVVWGVIDIDSTELSTFDDVDAEYLERIAKIISVHVAEG